ncbi:hypothetical protein [Alicyclobacillus fodiniaquatilis]|uniref:Permuted papain-like amidase YaeF/Yiix C92 family enzyme n=1 Tax=Alicyclobacillus fodiniaquatilis TaxID=1661150 RepID=A0ABW4JJJ4_9BACL
MLHTGDLIFVRGQLSSLVDDAIQTGEWLLDHRGQYVHVAVYVGGNTIMEAQGFRRSGRANIGDYAEYYDIGHIKMTDDQRDRFLAALHDEDNLPYDWPGIWWLIVYILTCRRIGGQYRERRRRYCSKYVGWALRQAGIIVNDRTPQDLADSSPTISIEKVGAV